MALAVVLVMPMLLGLQPVAARAGNAPPQAQIQLNGAYFWLQLDPIGRQDVAAAEAALAGGSVTSSVYKALFVNNGIVLPLPSYFVNDYSSSHDAGMAVAQFFQDISLTGFAGSQEAAISEFLNFYTNTKDNETLENLVKPQGFTPDGLDYLGDYYQYLLDVQSAGVPFTPSSVSDVFGGSNDEATWLANGMKHVGTYGGVGVNDKALFTALSQIWRVPWMAQAQVDADRAMDTASNPVGVNAEIAMAKAYIRSRASYTSVAHQVGQEDVFSLAQGSSTAAGQIEVAGNPVSGLSYTTDSANVTVPASGASLTVTGVKAGPQAVQVTAYINNDAKNDWIYKGLVIVTPSGVKLANFSSGTSDEEVIGTADAAATATNKVSATGSGSSQVTVADYDSNPGGSITSFNASGNYFDVTIVPDGSYGSAPGTLLGTTFSSVTISVPVSSADATVYWWNGTSWTAANSQSYANGVITVTVNSSSSPALDDLTGTPFTWGTPKGGPGPNPVPPVPPVTKVTATASLPPGAMIWPYKLIKYGVESFNFNKGINYQFTATKGTPPYTWSIVPAHGTPGTFTWTPIPGSLPPGLTLSSSGLLSGTPKTLQSIGYFLLPVTVKDSTGATYSMNVKLFIAAFPDVIGDWAVNDIDQLATHQVTFGYPDHMFWPKKDITRGEWAQMLVLSQGLKPLYDFSDLKQFTDYASMAPWQKPYLAAAVKAGLMFGYGQDKPGVYVMAANKYISREEMAATIGRTYHGVSPTDLDGYFKDGYKIHNWMHNFRNDVGIALHEGVIKGYPDDTFKPYNYTLRDETAAMVARWMGIADPNE